MSARPGRRNAVIRFEGARGSTGLLRGSLKTRSAPATPAANVISASASTRPASSSQMATEGSTMPGALSAAPM